MNKNPFFCEFEKAIGIDVEQDEYTGKNDIYYVYVYEDEKPILHGDDKPIQDICYMQLKLYTPIKYDYLELKTKTRDYFEEREFLVTDIFTFRENGTIKGNKMRCTVFKMICTDVH